MSDPKRGVVSLVLGNAGWVFAVFLVIGVGVMVPGLVMLDHALRLEAGGADATGTVEKLWAETHSCGKDDMDTCNGYHVRYGFVVAGVHRDDEADVASDFYAGLGEGKPIAVRYLPTDPAINEVEFGFSWFGGAILLLFGLIFGLVGAIPLGLRLRFARRAVALREDGVARGAKVTAKEATNLRINNRMMYVIRWTDSAGVSGKSRSRGADGLPEVGTEIRVFADPEGKVPPVWAGDTGER